MATRWRYCRDDGTAAAAEGEVSTPHTGDWDTVLTAVDTDLYYDGHTLARQQGTDLEGDAIIVVSDEHSETPAAINFWEIDTNTGSTYGSCTISVDDDDMDVHSKGATFHIGSGADVWLIGGSSNGTHAALRGLNITTDDDMFITGSINAAVDLYDCTVAADTGGDTALRLIYGSVNLIDTDIKTDGGHGAVPIYGNGVHDGTTICGGRLDTDLPTDKFIYGDPQGNILVENFDLSDLSRLDSILARDFSLYGKYAARITFRNCILSPDLSAWTSGGFATPQCWLLVYGCGSTNLEAEYQYYFETVGVSMEAVTGVYRDNSDGVGPSGTQVSMKVTTGGHPSLFIPVRFKLPLVAKIDLGSASADLLTFYITSDTQLYEEDLILEARYRDATNTRQINVASSRTLLPGPGMLGNSDELATSTEAWTGAKTYRYKVEIDTSGDGGIASYPDFYISVAKPNTVYYLCLDFDEA